MEITLPNLNLVAQYPRTTRVKPSQSEKKMWILTPNNATTKQNRVFTIWPTRIFASQNSTATAFLTTAMPGQFIKVKEPRAVLAREAFSDSVKKQDLSKCDTDSNYSNSMGDICRICHCEADAENPLLSPCYCAGSLKYVHQNCLRQWLAASDTRSCELCKFNFILHTKIKPLSEVSCIYNNSIF